MSATTRIGSWSSIVDTFSSSPDREVEDLLGHSADYHLMKACGALDELRTAYRAAIEDALPPSVSLIGDDFVGDATPAGDAFDGYPLTDEGGLDIQACLVEVDLDALAVEYEVITLEEIGRHVLKSKAANPSSAASQALRRVGLRPLARCQIDGRGQAVAVYYRREVERALAGRPGRGVRSDHPKAT